MAALTGVYLSTQYGGVSGPVPERIYCPIADNVLIYQGALVQFNPATGYCYPAGSANTADTHTYITLGRATQTYDNTVAGHAAAALTVEIAQGAFLWDAGTSGDALAQTNCFAAVYAIDDHTVGATSGSTTRAVAGILLGFSNDATARPIVYTCQSVAQ